MFRKLLRLIATGLAVASPLAAAEASEPGAGEAIYNLLFCDDFAAFRPTSDSTPTDWQDVLFGPGQDPAKVAELASDAAAESRVRALAFNWLRAHGHETPKGVVLGVVIEVPLDQGLDVLAAYGDGSVRYINRSGKVVIVEPGGLPEASRQAERLVELAQPLVAQIGPWDKARLPPPVRPNVRITFIVSDGLYFGEGPVQAMERDALAAPILQQGGELLTLVVDRAIANGGK